MTRNLLVFTYYFPPAETIAAQRFGKMCRYMEPLGWKPFVVCPCAEGSLDHGLPPEQIIRIGRWDNFAGRADKKKSTRDVSRLWVPFYWLAKTVRLELRAFDLSVVSWGRQVQGVWSSLQNHLPTIDCVLSCYGPSAVLWLARRFAVEKKIPWIADYRDLCSLYPEHRGGLVSFLDRRLERHLLTRATGFTTVSPTLREMIEARFNLPGQVVFNGWDPGDLPGEPDPALPGDYLFYGGRLYPHQLESFRRLLVAMKPLAHLSLLFLSMGPPDLESQIRREAKRLDIVDRVHIREPLPPRSALAVAAAAVATLVFEDLGTKRLYSRGTLTGKLMQQIALPPPVLCLAREDSDMGLVLRMTGKGQLCSRVAETRDFLRSLADWPASTNDRVHGFCRERQAAELCAFLDRVIA